MSDMHGGTENHAVHDFKIYSTLSRGIDGDAACLALFDEIERLHAELASTSSYARLDWAAFDAAIGEFRLEEARAMLEACMAARAAREVTPRELTPDEEPPGEAGQEEAEEPGSFSTPPAKASAGAARRCARPTSPAASGAVESTIAAPRGWREDLCAIWPAWNDAIDAARRKGEDDLPALVFPVAARKGRGGSDASWIPDASHWVSMPHGLGPWARFALMSYLDRSEGVQFDPLTVGRVPDAVWTAHVNAAAGRELLVQGKLQEFDLQGSPAQRGSREPSMEQRVRRLQPLFAEEELWDALAAAANTYVLKRKWVPHAAPLSGEELRQRRFAGPFAVLDFIRYINTGIIPARQTPFPDELRDLGVQLSGGFEREVSFFHSRERDSFLRDLVRRLMAEPRPESTVLRINCLWSALMHNGLVGACRQVIEQYGARCTQEDRLRLPVIYIPVGLEAKAEYVSRRTAVRDLHNKLVVSRAQILGKVVQPLPENPTGEQIDGAIAQIRAELARSPALIVFGIYQVPVDLGPLQEELLDSPLPYLIQRLMPETGDFEGLRDPQIAHATQLLILADGPIESIAGLPVTSLELPKCPAEHFGALVRASGVARLERLRADPPACLPPLHDIVSSETELAIVETALALQERSADPCSSDGIGARVIRLVWGEQASPEGEPRVQRLLRALLSYLVEEARSSADAAWLVTHLHIVALMPCGIRMLTIARVMAGYVRGTAACGTKPRPQWCGSEAELWKAHPDALTDMPDEVAELKAHRALELTIQERVGEIQERIGALVVAFRSAVALGFDEYAHPYECQEVPPFKFDFSGTEARQQLEFVAPIVRRTVLEELRARCPQRHSLLSRLLAEEYIRRAVIVGTHRTDTDLRSLVDYRYVILGIHHGLDSLAMGLRQTLSAHGRARCGWLIPHRTRLATYHWIYQGLYVELLNGGDNALSQQHGAELVKRRLLEELLQADPRPDLHTRPQLYRDPSTLRHFEVRAEILHGLAHVGVYNCDAALASDALQKVQELTSLVCATLEDPQCQLSAAQKSAWSSRISEVGRQSAKLMFDLAVSQSAWQLTGDPGQLGRLVNMAFDAMEDPAARPVERGRIIRAVMRALRESQALSAGTRPGPASWEPALRRAAREIRERVPEAVMQYCYDLLMRYGELVMYSANRMPEDRRRARRRRSALLIFEVAETLRSRYTSSAGSILSISPRPSRNAARLCLSLARSSGSSWFRERAGYYCLHVMESRSQQRIDRIVMLVLRAMTIRMLGTAEELPLAMQFLKTAERSLINYADRVELWIRFYLERAKLFKARALQPGTPRQDAHWCVCYCRSDVAAIVRLAAPRGLDGWVARAERILQGLPFLASAAPAARAAGSRLIGPMLPPVAETAT